jgi:hypothetical protein
MGVWLHMVAVRHDDRSGILKSMQSALTSQHFLLHDAEPADADDKAWIHEPAGGWTCVEFAWSACDLEALGAHVARTLETTVFLFQIHDGDFWMFRCFDNGRTVGKFASMLTYFEDPWDPEEWGGRIEEIQKLLGAGDPLLKSYLVHLGSGEDERPKVHPSDGFALSDPWVVADFMDRLGVGYPEDEVEVPSFWL